ncbi:hypothetical protein E5358_06900 [Palleniella muris]|uniref:Uncharacterized protein n=1 Tax=Palleniella muris TaxID=3038145 RepID=A0AC61QQM5_9BACT|nr:hypothetical protein [Palleniella muris]TGX82490.1 hypothetical protein E5358_06900 [Palleniella muris]
MYGCAGQGGYFNVYGGIHHPVHLIVTGEDCISPLFYGSPGVILGQKDVSGKSATLTSRSRQARALPTRSYGT